MGSLTSRPKSVPIPQTVYVPNPQNVSQNVSQNVTIPTKAPSSISPTEPSAEDAIQKRREDNLLRRDRGRSGTVQTGFRGILNAVDAASKKKTLLGE